jgi:hypothetical protein
MFPGERLSPWIIPVVWVWVDASGILSGEREDVMESERRL